MAETREPDLRYSTLSRLEEILKLLVEHHGGRMTLAELLAITAGMARLCHQDQVTIAEIAAATGLPKQSLSRWASKRVGKSIKVESDPDDQRAHNIQLIDDQRGQAHLERMAQLLGLEDTAI